MMELVYLPTDRMHILMMNTGIITNLSMTI